MSAYKRNTVILAVVIGLLCGAVMYGFCGMMFSSLELAHHCLRGKE